MSLFSVTFAVFLVITGILYFSVPKNFQWVLLLVASYVFYAWADWRLLCFLVFATLSTFAVGRWLQSLNDKYALENADLKANKDMDKKALQDAKKSLKDLYTKKKRWVLVVGVVSNFLVLATVKYLNFAIENLNVIFSYANTDFELSFLNIALPLGISFYTFQSVGYLIDIYRGKVKADRNIFKYALFVSYFPQIIQGPIGRYNQLASQLYEKHEFDYTRVKFGAQLMLWGIFKKMVIADRVAVVVNQVFNNFYAENYGGFIVFIAAFLYSVQIYADFSGGIDVISGISQIFGIELAENFRRPFMAKSVAEFWQRWHITLGAWMRDYLFYPLALSKPFNNMAKKLRKFGSNYAAKIIPTCLASFIVFIIIGVWHGSSWKYVAYGIYNAVFVSSATLLEPFYEKCRKFFRVKPERFSFRLFQIIRTILIVTIGRYFSRAASFMTAMSMYKATLVQWNPWVLFNGKFFELGLDRKNFQFMILMIVLLFLLDFLKEKGYNLRETIARQGIVFRWIIYIFAILGIIIFGMYGEGFNASSFIYQGF